MAQGEFTIIEAAQTITAFEEVFKRCAQDKARGLSRTRQRHLPVLEACKRECPAEKK